MKPLLLVAMAAMLLLLVENVLGYANIQGVIVQPQANANDRAGLGHIAMSSDGTTLAFATDIEVDNGDGGVYIYVREDTTFDYQAGPLRNIGQVPSKTRIGETVALNADGTILVVSAPHDDNDRGALLVFEKTDNTWSPLGTKLVEETPADDALFGRGKISISGDGTYIAAGSVQSDGKVTLFSRTGEGGTYEVNKTISLGTTFTDFTPGLETLLSADGSTLLVYTLVDLDDPDVAGFLAFWVYSHNVETDEWTAVATQIVVGDVYDTFSASAISLDGKTLAFARQGKVTREGREAAVIYVLEEGSYVNKHLIVDPEFAIVALSNNVALANNGRRLVVGMPGYESGVGGAMAFILVEGTWYKSHTRVFELDEEGIKLNSLQGANAAFSEDGEWMALSAPYFGVFRSPNFVAESGGIFVFNHGTTNSPTPARTTSSPFGRELPSGTESFSEVQKIKLEDARPYEQFGDGVAISADGKTAVATAFGRLVAENEAGGLYIYTRSETATEWEFSTGPVFAQSSITTPFGSSSTGLAISGDGTIIVAEAPEENNRQGVVGVIRFDGENWVPFGPAITRDDPVVTGGLTVALSADASVLAVGERSNRVGGIELHVKTESGYARSNPILIGTGRVGDNVQGGHSVVLSGDGSTLAFSAPGDNSAKGAIWAFKRDSEFLYHQVGNKLTQQDAIGLGQRLAISADGSVIVGTGKADELSVLKPFPIAFVVFRYNSGTNVYQRIQSQVPYTDNYFGYPFAVALTGSGDALLLGESNQVRLERPEGKITRMTRSSDGTYEVAGREFIGNNQVSSFPLDVGFGYTVSVSADGKRLVSGANGDDVSRGAVYFFDLTVESISPTTAPPSSTSKASSTFEMSRMLVSTFFLALTVLVNWM